MECYRVGGAVRDRLLGRPPGDVDWVVVGATPEMMEDAGYRPVGRDFPVFLHPATGEEYALARTERKTAPGYHGFTFHAAPDVTLEEDLARRDLTINAMAETADGELVDPYGGEADLAAGRLRHVTPAFAEDPVRILRLARFAARFAPLGFEVADETRELMRTMVADGEVDALVAERVWAELEKALAEPDPGAFIEVLRDCGALAVVFPEIDALFGVPQPEKHHPEVDTGVHTLLVLAQAARLSPEPETRFAALVHDLGKGTTPPAEWPRHIGHEARGTERVEALCARLRAPKAYRDLGRLTAGEHTNAHRALELRPTTCHDLLARLDALRRPERFERFLLACEADSRGRPGYEEAPYPQADFLRRARAAAAAVDPRPLAAEGYRGEAMAAALKRARVAAINELAPGRERPGADDATD
ncbi:MAG: multifunctional CCA addition/repair protein [Pseudomonadota bacterium]